METPGQSEHAFGENLMNLYKFPFLQHNNVNTEPTGFTVLWEVRAKKQWPFVLSLLLDSQRHFVRQILERWPVRPHGTQISQGGILTYPSHAGQEAPVYERMDTVL